MALRASDIGRFFDHATTPSVRAAIARYYAVTKIIVPNDKFQLLGTLAEAFGEPVYRDDSHAILDVRDENAADDADG